MTDKATSGQSVQKSPEGLFLQDGIEGLHSLPRHSVDMLLTDPPYGTTRNFWDVPLPLPELWEAVKWAVKPEGAVLFFAQCPYDKVLGASNLSMLRYLPLCPYGTPAFDAIPSARRMRKGVCRQCAAFALGGQPSADVLFCVALTQAIQPDRPLTARRQHGHIFAVGSVLYHISLPPQEHQKCLVGVRLSDDAVNIAANDTADGGLAGVLRFPFGVVFPLALRRDSG